LFEGAADEDAREVAAVLRAGVEIRRRIRPLVRGCGRVLDRCAGSERLLDASTTQRRRTHVDKTDPGVAVANARDADDGPVLSAPVELLERPSRARRLRHSDLGQQFLWFECRLEEAGEEVVDGDLARAVGSLRDQRRSKGDQDCG